MIYYVIAQYKYYFSGILMSNDAMSLVRLFLYNHSVYLDIGTCCYTNISGMSMATLSLRNLDNTK